MRVLLGCLLIALLLAAAIPLHEEMAAIHQTYPTEFRSYYVPSSTYLQVASLGQKNFVSDLVFIWAVQFFDRYAQSVRDEYLFHTFDVITDLDPRFTEAYIFGDLFLSLDRRFDLIYKLADKGITRNPKEWLVAWDAGSYAFFQAKDYAQAQRFFRVAADRNPDRTILQDLLANAYKYKGDYQNSLDYWQAILARHKNDDSHQGRFFTLAAERNIFDLTIKINLRDLNEAVAAYRAAKGAPPPVLGALTSAGFLKSIPVDPTGKPYTYNPKTGEVSCQTPFQFRGKYSQW